MSESEVIKIFIKIKNKSFYTTAERYGLSMYNMIHDTDNYTYAVFILSDSTNDVHSINIIRKLMSCIFNTELLSEEETETKLKNRGFYIIPSEYDEDITIGIYTILLAFVDYMREKYDAKHYTERLHNFYKENYIELSGNIPVVHWLNDGTFTFTPLVYIDSAIISTDSFIEDKKTETVSVRSENNRAYYRNFNWQNLYRSCYLFRMFVNGNKNLSDTLLFLARNICGAEKGKKMFLEIIKSAENQKYNYNIRHWKEILNGIVKGNVPLQKCAECPYSSDCCHAENLLETACPKKNDVVITQKTEYVSLEEVEQDLTDKFNQAINSSENGIHIVKAQTGLGKTTNYINYLQKADKPCIIAVPTHNLKDEIFCKAVNSGVKDICRTPALPESSISPEIIKKVNHLYAVGAGKEVIPYLAGLLSKMDKNDENYDIIKDYLNDSKKTSNYKGHIITTHAKFFMMSEENLEGHQIIIDEDILRQLYNTDCVPMKDIRSLTYGNNNISEKVSEKFRAFIHNRGYRLYNSITEKKNMGDLNGINSNIYGLINAEITYSDSEKVLFVDKKDLPNRKIIIMSATIDSELYKKFFPERNIIRYECKKAKYKGKIIQHADSSYSRADFQKDNSKIHKLKHIANGNPVITFQSIEHYFDTKYHFGNIEGLNILEGKDLFVIGLPNLPEEVYMLYGICAGVSPERNKMRPQRIEYNGYSFRPNTFDNPILRRIQMWILSSQLEQSVGRARLLRNDCTVRVFSGFPVEQAFFQK